MLEDHLACPKCGYDLHGIPEARCPECGFGYDAAALRSIASAAEWTRPVAARYVIVRATIGGALAVPAACDQFGLPTWTELFVVVVAYVAAFLAWVVFTDAYRGLGSIPTLFTLFVALALGIWLILSLMLPVFRFVALVGGIIMLTLAWFVRLLNWTTLSPLGNVRSTGLHQSVVRHSVGGTVAVVVASILVLVAWPG